MTDLETLRVDRAGELPPGVQLAWQLRALIAGGRMAPGDRLPGVRDLAATAGVNANTARAVYQRLEADGFLESRQGLGTFVAAGAPSSADTERIATEAVAEARRVGVSAADVARSILATATLDDPQANDLPLDVGRPADEAAARRELRRQIAKLEAALAAYPAAGSKRETHPLLRPKGRIAGFDELSAIRDELIELLRDARQKAERDAERAARARSREARS